MKQFLLTHQELMEHFATAQTRPAKPLLALLTQHLENESESNASASIGRALQESGWRESLLSPPLEILPPLA